MSTITLEVQPRDAQTPRQLRRTGLVPGITYGPGRQAVPVQVTAQTLVSLIRQGGQHHPFVLRQSGAGGEQVALLKEVQWSNFSPFPVHFDAMLVSPDRPVTAEVPLRLVGEAELRKRGLIIQHQRSGILVEALPSKLPGHLPLALADLAEGTAVTAGDIPLPAGVTLKDEPQLILFSVITPALKLSETSAEAEVAATSPPQEG